MGVEENGLNDTNLPARVGQVGAGAHEGGPKDDGKIVRVHAGDGLVVGYTVKMERQGAQGGVVRVIEAVDDGVQHVSADCHVVVF